jgi:hypothetical protein
MDNNLVALLVLIVLQVKHYVVDFPLQVEYQWRNKGTYGHPGGLIHAGSHGLGTFIVLGMVFGMGYWFFALIMAIFDAVTHYHIDYVKMRFGCRDVTNPTFWNHLGLDQMAHQFVYIIIAGVCVV